MDKAQQDALKKAAGIEAAKLIQDGMIAGLGTGSTVRFLVDELGRRVQEEGLKFTGVTTSRRTQEQAEGYGIKIVNIDDVDHIDITIDGASRTTHTICSPWTVPRTKKKATATLHNGCLRTQDIAALMSHVKSA